MKFYEFNQNNSGGSFDVDDKVCHRVFIESDNKDEAIDKALELGIYFDGVRDGIDCPCCGDRWSDYCDEIEFPYEYDKEKTFNSIEEYAQYLADKYGWTSPDCRIYYKNGEVKEIFTKK